MKNIILIEDRIKRQDSFLNSINLNLTDYKNISNPVQDELSYVLDSILENKMDFEKYNIIICHKSLNYKKSNHLLIENLKKYCKENKKSLVLFSGGISTNFYDNSFHEYLELNSKTLYSNNLKLFLEASIKNKENIQMLCYGKNWELNIASGILEKINIFINNRNDEDIRFNELLNVVDVNQLLSIDFQFYQMQIEDGWVYKNEIKKMRNSILDFCLNQKNINTVPYDKDEALLIHNNNVEDIFIINNRIRFSSEEDIDKYISEYIIPEIKSKKFNKIFIKDSLSSNYLELLGIRVAYHIRFSIELNELRFCPIVIISEFNESTLFRFNQDANILFTEGIYLCQNSNENINEYLNLQLKGLDKNNYISFLNTIIINPPKDITGAHDISNTWCIYKWSKSLNIKSEALDSNNKDVQNNLYFKYLSCLNENSLGNYKLKNSNYINNGKVLLIDDQWNKGWKDIIKRICEINNNNFYCLEYFDKDIKQFGLMRLVKNSILETLPDVVILDLRFLESDYENDDINNFTGIKILNRIYEINAGIQVIMLTASSKSIILEKLYEKNILGYVKKEHPQDNVIDSEQNINKFIELIDYGISRKYLKDIWQINKSIKSILDYDIFKQYNIQFEDYNKYLNILKKENSFIYDILDSKNTNKFAYAALSMARFWEAIESIFISENRKVFWDGEECVDTTIYKKLQSLITKLDNQKTAKKIIDSELNTLIYKRNRYLHANEDIIFNVGEITKGYTKLLEILKIIENPKDLKFV